MVNSVKIREHYEIIGADGVHVGTVERVEGSRIKLARQDNEHTPGKHRYIPLGLVADIEGEKVRLSANADVAICLEDED